MPDILQLIVKNKRKLIAELFGTFVLVFCGTGAIITNEVSGGAVSHTGIAITFGLVVIAMIYSIGSISGAHINPAVTLAFYFAKRFEGSLVPLYIISQIIGGILASMVLHYLFPSNVLLGTTLPSGPVLQSFILEFLLTLFLMFVIINVATGNKEQGLMAGIAIGFVVLFEAQFAGPITGASMNPARSIGPALVSGHLEHLWIYLLAPILGAISGILIWKTIKE